MTGAEVRAARKAPGLSMAEVARLLRVRDGRTIGKWQSGESRVPGPAAVLIEALLASAARRERLGVTLAHIDRRWRTRRRSSAPSTICP